MNILDYFHIDKDCLVSSVISKQMIYEQGELASKDREIFVNEVNKIVWEYTLKEDNTGFKSYKDEEVEYEEVEVIKVVLKEKKQYKKIANILQKLMPYPIILIFEYDNEILINTSFKKINKNDEEKSTIDDMNYLEWFCIDNIGISEEVFLNSLNIKNILVNDFYKLYKKIDEAMLIYNTSITTGIKSISASKSLEEIKHIKVQIDGIDNYIKTLERKLSKEKQINKRIDYQMDIRKNKIKKDKLIKELEN